MKVGEDEGGKKPPPKETESCRKSDKDCISIKDNMSQEEIKKAMKDKGMKPKVEKPRPKPKPKPPGSTSTNKCTDLPGTDGKQWIV